MLKQISFAAIAMATLSSVTLDDAVAFPGFLPSAVLAATQATERQPLVANIPVPIAERAPMVVRIGDRAHLFDGYFYCERPGNPLPKALEALDRSMQRQDLSFLKQ
jgi:hypothetical protein